TYLCNSIDTGAQCVEFELRKVQRVRTQVCGQRSIECDIGGAGRNCRATEGASERKRREVVAFVVEVIKHNAIHLQRGIELWLARRRIETHGNIERLAIHKFTDLY